MSWDPGLSVKVQSYNGSLRAREAGSPWTEENLLQEEDPLFLGFLFCPPMVPAYPEDGALPHCPLTYRPISSGNSSQVRSEGMPCQSLPSPAQVTPAPDGQAL